MTAVDELDEAVETLVERWPDIAQNHWSITTGVKWEHHAAASAIDHWSSIRPAPDDKREALRELPGLHRLLVERGLDWHAQRLAKIVNRWVEETHDRRG